ncbi:MAG TPA: PstS family phosphate ABC transporter substrate-binding protein [Polyangiales bacterium]|jgi:phosphate transport system substrate-binding protein|nr:PstS family phosphate ABC transporter substrate-binding protein [Polyangiales bacterium]
MQIQRIFVVAVLLAACSKNAADAPGAGPANEPAPAPGAATPAAKPAEQAPTVVAIDGSSTVFPITEAVAEEFQKQNQAKVTIGVSGTGGGFKKFCAGEIAIADASRPIKATEAEACAAKKIEFIELPVAYDGLAVVVNSKNDWAKMLTVDELKKLWEPGAQGKVTKWSQVRTGFPDKEIRLFGPGVDSGTYDYFTKAIVGEEHKSRGDYTASEDDNVLVQGVSRDQNALGFFGLAYYEENKDTLELVPIDDGKDDDGKGPIAPSAETVANGTYQPLSRPIFIYVSKNELRRPELKAFVEYYLKNGEKLVKEARYVPLPPKAYELATARFQKGTTGSLFGSAGSQVGVTVEALLARE